MRRLCISIISVALLVTSTVTVAAGSDPQSRPAIPSAGCGSSMAEPGMYSGTMEFAGLERSWELMIPSVHDGQAPVPLVVGLHGGSEFYSSELLLALAEEEGFVAAMPRDAYQDWWMVWEPQLPGYDLSRDNPDVAFVDGLIDRLGEDLCLDLARVYGTGFCVGAGGLSVLGCVLDDRLAAVASAAIWATDLGDACDTERPVPTLAVHGTADMDVLYDGGAADWFLDYGMKDGSRVRESAWGQWLMGATGDPVPDRLAVLAERYGCEPEPAIEPLGEAEHYVWACPEGAAVELIAHGGGHTWSSITDGRSTEQLVWEFLEQHSLPEWHTHLSARRTRCEPSTGSSRSRPQLP